MFQILQFMSPDTNVYVMTSVLFLCLFSRIDEELVCNTSLGLFLINGFANCISMKYPVNVFFTWLGNRKGIRHIKRPVPVSLLVYLA